MGIMWETTIGRDTNSLDYTAHLVRTSLPEKVWRLMSLKVEFLSSRSLSSLLLLLRFPLHNPFPLIVTPPPLAIKLAMGGASMGCELWFRVLGLWVRVPEAANRGSCQSSGLADIKCKALRVSRVYQDPR